MPTNKIHHLRIFISSVMKNDSEPNRKRILDIRLALYNQLALYPFIEPYILEKESPSALDLQTAYLTPLRESNLVVILLDSHYPIPKGVQIEISKSRQENIPRMYFIIPSGPGEAAAMRAELLNQHESNFIPNLPKSDNYVELIENAIINQLVTVFQAFFHQKNQVIPETDDEDYAINSSSTLLTSSQFKKEMFNHVGLSKQTIRKLIFHDIPNRTVINSESPLDENIYNLLNCLLYNKPLPYYWNKTMLEAIKDANIESPLSSEFIMVLEQRLKAVVLFFSQKYKEASNCLKQLLQASEVKNLPNWILQDTLIDLRNLLVFDDTSQKVRNSENPYQLQLNQSTSPFYYPGIDRSLTVVYAWVQSERNKFHTSSSSEESFYGPGINRYPDAITDAEIFAACNGSITQIRQLPNHLNIISEMFLQRYENRIYLRDVVQNELLMGKSYNQINRWLNRYSFLQGQFTDEDAMSILNTAQSYSVNTQKLAIEATAMRIAWDHLTNDHFEKEWQKLFDHIQSWLNASELVLHPAKEVLGLFRYCFRIPQEHIVFIISKLSSSMPRYYDELSEIISGAIDHENASINNRTALTDALLVIVKSKKETSFTTKIENALLSAIMSWPDESAKLLTYLKNNRSNYFNQNIMPYLWQDDTDTEFPIFINKQIDDMKSQNKRQDGKIISMFSTNPFAAIYNTLSDSYPIENSFHEKILQEVVATLNNPHQTIDAKQSAVKLMLLIISKNKTHYIDILSKIELTSLSAETISFVEASTPTQYIEVIRTIIRISLSGKDNGKLLTILTLNQSAKYLYFVSELLIDFLPIAIQTNSLSNTIPQIIQFLITNNNFHERENELIANISNCFLILIDCQIYSGIALGQLQRLVSDTNNIVQRQLVSQIRSLSTDKQNLLNSIKSQLLSNSNYSVRDFAKRSFE